MIKRHITSALLLALSSLTFAACADVDSEPFDSSDVGLSARPSFDVFKGADGRFYFNFSAANHEIILSSQGYRGRTPALAGVLSVLDNASSPSAFEVNPARGGFYFNLKAANGQIIATSEVYSTKGNANRGVETVIDNVGDYLAFSAARTGARFIVFENSAGGYNFQLRAKNGRVVLRSESYTSEAAALNGTFSVADNGTREKNFEILEAANGDYYFNLKATNGQIIGTSQMYSTKSNATRGMRSMVALIPSIDLM